MRERARNGNGEKSVCVRVCRVHMYVCVCPRLPAVRLAAPLAFSAATIQAC